MLIYDSSLGMYHNSFSRRRMTSRFFIARPNKKMMYFHIIDEHGAKNKSEAILYYNTTKGSVYTADEMLRCYSTKVASRQRLLHLGICSSVFNLLDIICLNSLAIAKDICMTHGSRHDFLLHLVELPCATERQRYSASHQPIQSSQQSTIGTKVVALPDGKKTTCRLFQKNKT